MKDPLRVMRSQFRAVAAAASAMGAALSAAALKGAGEIDRAAKAARRLDASIGAFRALELAAGEAGVPLSAVTNDIQNIGREIANIGVGGNADRALKRLGLAAADLDGLDADAKVATIADAVKGLGLSAGEATAVLRDLGVRNREMALVMIQGGEAIRAAREDVEDYGLSLDAVEAGKIEAANDRIARLGLISRYAGQQLALRLVPALGRAAQAMTEALREGGLLRRVIDGLTENLARISTWIGTAVTAFGVRYVGALAAARLATLSMAGSLAMLRGALIRSGIGIAVIAAGELVYQLGRLVTATGGFGEALDLMKDVAAEVWERIVMGPKLMRLRMEELGARMKAIWGEVMVYLQEQWTDFLGKFAELPDFVPGAKAMKAAADGAADGLTAAKEAAAAAGDEAQRLKLEANGIADAMIRTPLASMQALKETLAGVSEEAGNTATNLARIGDAAGGDGGTVTQATGQLADTAKTASDSFKTFFKDVAKGSADAGDAISALADRMLDDLLDRAMSPLSDALGSMFDGLFSGLFGSGGRASGGGGTVTQLFPSGGLPGFARGTDSAPGGLAWVGEAGPELVNLPRGAQVIPNHRLGSLGGGSVRMGDVHVSVAQTNADPRQIAEAVRRVSREEAQRVYARQRREGR
ncbi:phage tail tape measure protein [Rhodovulum sulfidophilum]|uniref:phage tail tape measure protein n=1 Tax=Rhodovulum sulfidophilum TaxID=35806 RepID=UPI00117B8289|nr:phage tail tape measure protein [Rhodovulum sulfidophilum]